MERKPLSEVRLSNEIKRKAGVKDRTEYQRDYWKRRLIRECTGKDR